MSRKHLCWSGGLLVAALVFTGCLLSGTFVVDQSFNFSGGTGFYYYAVDITGEPVWQDHKDDIDNIDLVGFELWLHNSGSSDLVFNAYVDDYDHALCTDNPCLTANTTKTMVIDNLTVAPGDRHITYGESFKYLVGIDRLKALAKEGKLNLYATSDGGGTLRVDSAKVVITLSASTGGI